MRTTGRADGNHHGSGQWPEIPEAGLATFAGSDSAAGDRLLRFGSELVFALCERQGIEVVIIHPSELVTFEEELAADVWEIITVFSARLSGRRSHKTKRILKALQDAGDEPAPC